MHKSNLDEQLRYKMSEEILTKFLKQIQHTIILDPLVFKVTGMNIYATEYSDSIHYHQQEPNTYWNLIVSCTLPKLELKDELIQILQDKHLNIGQYINNLNEGIFTSSIHLAIDIESRITIKGVTTTRKDRISTIPMINNTRIRIYPHAIQLRHKDNRIFGYVTLSDTQMIQLSEAIEEITQKKYSVLRKQESIDSIRIIIQ